MTKTLELKFVLIWKELFLFALIFTIFLFVPTTYNYFGNFRVRTCYKEFYQHLPAFVKSLYPGYMHATTFL